MSAVIDEMAIDLNNLDKSSWKTYRFDEIAQNISERVDPNNTDLTVYIGLEHLDSGSIHIKRSGTPEDVNGQKLRFYKGDVIFGRRRAYQRKAGVATCDGFCSAHALVLRANPDVIEPELFPFFLHSDLFMNRALDISVGSLSPTINWGALRSQEFLIPPLIEQVAFTNTLTSLDSLLEKKVAITKKIEKIKQAIQRRSFGEGGLPVIKLENCGRVFSGGTPNRKKKDYWGGKIPWVKTAEVNYNFITNTEECITEEGLNNSAAKLVGSNSVLIAMYGEGVTRGRVAINRMPVSCNQACAVVEPNEMFEAEFIYNFLEFSYEELRALAHGANQKNLNLKMIKSFNIPRLGKELQRKINRELKSIRTLTSHVNAEVLSLKMLEKTIINQVF